MSAINVCLLAVAWIGAKAIIVSGNVKGVAGGLTTGELMSLFTYALQILMCTDDDLHGIRYDHHCAIFCRAYR